MKHSIIALLILFVTNLQAGELSLQLSGISRHSNPSHVWNERNSGVGFTYQVDNQFVAVGAYTNSYFRQTNYILVGIRKDIIKGDAIIAPGIMTGGLTGYQNATVAVIAPMLTLGYRGIKINVLALPSYNQFDGVLFTQLEITLGGKQ